MNKINDEKRIMDLEYNLICDFIKLKSELGLTPKEMGEASNTISIDNGINQSERLKKLNATARKELSILSKDKNVLGIEKLIDTKNINKVICFLIKMVYNREIYVIIDTGW